MTVKERMIRIILEMDEKDVQSAFKALEPFELEETAYPDEIEAMEKYKAGDPEYQPYITHEELLKELGLTEDDIKGGEKL